MAQCKPYDATYNDYQWSEHGLRESTEATDAWIAEIVKTVVGDWNKARRIPNIRVIVEPKEAVGVRFYRLAADWSANTRGISSLTELVKHPSYQEIMRLGWDVVPYLLQDLQENKRFWFPALTEITKVRPFDAGDIGNSRRMTKAWIEWGRRKHLI
jgi:hypothetical protein